MEKNSTDLNSGNFASQDKLFTFEKLSKIRQKTTTANKYRLAEVIDIQKLQELLDYFYKTTGISNAVADIDGTILMGTGWQDLCVKFHRVNPATQKRCAESDSRIKDQLPNEPYVTYQCQNGLVDIAMPIIIDGEHLATFYIGQFFFEKPDEDFFMKQAMEMGFDWSSYRAALGKVPVFAREKINEVIQYNLKFIQMFAELGLRQKKLLDLNAQLDATNISLNQKIVEHQRAREDFHKLNDELEQRVKDRTAQLTNANHELEAFSYSVSHDLRTPIRSIDGFSRILEDEYGDCLGSEGKDYLRRVREATRRMGQLIDDLLSLSHVTRREMTRQNVNLSLMARKIADDLIKLEMERSVEIIIAPDMNVLADEALMQIVMENLIRNAWKFTRKETHARIELGTINQDGQTVYFIRDNGVGFDMAYASKLFGAFQRLHSMQDFEGTGVGLATVHRIIRRHGGKIWAEGKINQGSTFYFTL
jgi:signal transduction histidine kinase